MSRQAAKACSYCGYSNASSRHFIARCPVFTKSRRYYALSFSGDATEELFDALPDCTVKSAWVTTDAHPEPERRVDLQIALANLGLDVLFSPDETLKGEPHWTTAQEIEEIMNISTANRAAHLAAPPFSPNPQSLILLMNTLRIANDGVRAPLTQRLPVVLLGSAVFLCVGNLYGVPSLESLREL